MIKNCLRRYGRQRRRGTEDPYDPVDEPHESVLHSVATGVNDTNTGASPGALEPYQER